MFNVCLVLVIFMSSFLALVIGSKGRHGLIEYMIMSLISTVFAWGFLDLVQKAF